jgi:D-alanine-D-alanine ligase
VRVNFPFDTVVVVADTYRDEASSQAVYHRRDLEQTDRETMTHLFSAISALNLGVRHYQTPAELARNAHLHKNDVVLTIFGGAVSRSRMSLVPAVCEAFGLHYIGPDAYGRFLCQDKFVTKQLAIVAGLQTPNAEVIRSADDLQKLSALRLPFVIKPLLEGSSIGIAPENLIRDRVRGVAQTTKLLEEFSQPVLAEEFQPGREVSCNFIFSPRQTDWAFVEMVKSEDEGFFDTNLFDAIEKTKRHEQYFVRAIDDLLSTRDLTSIQSLLQSIGKVDYCRVDGKWHRGRFIFLELSPDAWISPEGAFAGGFIEKGWTYPDVIASILRCAVGPARLFESERPPAYAD